MATQSITNSSNINNTTNAPKSKQQQKRKNNTGLNLRKIIWFSRCWYVTLCYYVNHCAIIKWIFTYWSCIFRWIFVRCVEKGVEWMLYNVYIYLYVYRLNPSFNLRNASAEYSRNGLDGWTEETEKGLSTVERVLIFHELSDICVYRLPFQA